MLLVALPLALCNDPTFGTIIAVGLLLCYIARAMELTLSLALRPLIPCSQHKKNTASPHRLFWLQIHLLPQQLRDKGLSHHEIIMRFSCCCRGR